MELLWLLCAGAIRYGNEAARHAVDTTYHISRRHLRTSAALRALLIDERWLAPHFEKMLYDNALLIT